CRNQALDLTEQYFPQATFMLMLDAEWILHHGDDLLRYCRQHKNDMTTLYMIQLKGLNVEFGHARLFKCGSNVRFFGKVHEIPDVPAQVRIPSSIYFELSPTHYGKEKSKTRWLRDRDILLQEVLNNPGDGRSVIFLAQTYFGLEDYENAAKWYEYRLTFPGFAEEIFLAYFCLAQSYSAMGNTAKMISNYFKAYSFRPHRAEPFVRLAEYFFIHEQYHLCYLFAKASAMMPYPTQDVAIVEKRLYDFVRYDLLSKVCALYEDYKLGEQATSKALEVEPNLEYLHYNLRYYRSMMH
nr:hypothetical protein [Candidatus Babeliales bacterium]